jgi:hypothetical protein
MTTEAWTDKQSREMRTVQRVLAEIVGPSLRWWFDPDRLAMVVRARRSEEVGSPT